MGGRPFVVFLLLAGGLAGCVGSDAEPAAATRPPIPMEAAPAEVTEETGGIEGIVLDEEQVPIGGATIALLETLNETTSAIDGRYSFSDILPGEYRIAASALGYESLGRKVVVVAGEVASVNFTLGSVLKEEAIIDARILKGFINCSVNFYYPTNVCQHVFQDTAKFQFQLSEQLAFKEILLELVWTPASAATGQRLELDLCKEQDNTTNQVNCLADDSYYKYSWGPSPRILRQSDLPVKETLKYETDVGDGFISTNTSSPWLVPVTYQQSFTLYMSLCYVQKCADEYQARPPDA